MIHSQSTGSSRGAGEHCSSGSAHEMDQRNHNDPCDLMQFNMQHEGQHTMQSNTEATSPQTIDDACAVDKLNGSFFIPTPKTTRKRQDLAPTCMTKIHSIGGMRLARPLIALPDSGSTSTLVQQRALPPGCQINHSNQQTVATTVNGSFDTSKSVTITQMQLPEFVNGRTIDGTSNARIFHAPSCRHDITFGRDLLTKAGIQFCFDTDAVQWRDDRVTMKPTSCYSHAMLMDVINVGPNPESVFTEWLCQEAHMQCEENEDVEEHELYQSEMLKQACGKVTSTQVAAKQTHLTQSQQNKLEQALERRKILFDGKLGRYPHKQFTIELTPDAKPLFQRPYPIPFRHEQVHTEEINEMINDGIPRRRHRGSKWCSPSFPTPKKDNRVRFATDYRHLNRHVVRQPCPMPKIQDIMQNRSNCDCFTKIDLSMMFHCFELDERSKELTTAIAPDGTLLECKVCPMGLKVSPDHAQADPSRS